jgi:hypothetical protein
MTIPRWLLILRFSPYAYFLVWTIGLVLSTWLKCSCAAAFTILFYIGAVWFVVARVMGWVLLHREVAMRRLSGETPTTQLGESTDAYRPIDEQRIRSALSRLDSLEGGSPAWLRADLDAWLAAPQGGQKNGMRDALLQRLYAEAGLPGDPAQRRALNDVRLAINPWINTD